MSDTEDPKSTKKQGAESSASAGAAEKKDSPKTSTAKKQPKEIGGRDGPEPTRYGDWENKGIISDF